MFKYYPLILPAILLRRRLKFFNVQVQALTEAFKRASPEHIVGQAFEAFFQGPNSEISGVC